MNVLYPAQITFDKSDNRFFVQFFDIPEAITEGESEEEALFNASESLTLAIEGRLEEGVEVPQPSLCTKHQNGQQFQDSKIQSTGLVFDNLKK